MKSLKKSLIWKMQQLSIVTYRKMPALTFDRNLGEISMEKEEFASYIKDYVKGILKYKPDAVYVEGELFIVYPVIRVLHKKHIPVYIKHQNGVVAI